MKKTKRYTAIRKMQPTLIHVDMPRDIVYTPIKLVNHTIDYYDIGTLSNFSFLDPCKGSGVWYNNIPSNKKQWCEIKKGVDFFSYDNNHDWVIGNPPYSCLIEWIRHSFYISNYRISYLLPINKVFNSDKFMIELGQWGGIAEVIMIGTGTQWGLPFGHAAGIVTLEKGPGIVTKWTDKREWVQ